jgi:ubiquinol-cytochrome c reductase cytochrome b subunit
MSTGNTTEGRPWKVSDFNYSVPAHALSFGYGIGGVMMVGFALQVLTGTLLALFYVPSVDLARESVARLSLSPLGYWLRSFHRWSAEGIMFLIVLHITRIIFTASYRASRKANWIFGVVLLLIAAGFVFTGTVIKMDQEGFEAYSHIVEGSGLIPIIGGALATLVKGSLAVVRLAAAHTVIMPALLLVFLVPHLVLMKLNGLSPLPGRENGRSTTFFAHLNRVMVFSLAFYGAMAFLAALLPTELYPGPYSGVEMTKPPWLFLPLYALEDWFGLYSLLIAPVLIVAGLIVIPFIDVKKDHNSIMRRVIVWGYIGMVAVVIFMILYAGLTPPVKHINMG